MAMSAKQEAFLREFMGLNMQRDQGGNVTSVTERPRDWGKFAKDALSKSWILAAPAAVAALPGVAAGGGAAAAGGGAAASTGGALSRVGNFAKNNWRDLATVGGAVYSGVKGAQNQGRANELNDQALELARADYEDRRPLRDAFTSGALTPIAQAPDLSSMFTAARSDNPFATGGPPRSAHVPSQIGGVGGPAPMAPPLPPKAKPRRTA